MAGGEQEVGQFRCVYRMSYQSTEELSEGVVDQFVRRNAPLQAWPFMRELVLNLTQRFGWTGFILPSFLIPPHTTGENSPLETEKATQEAKAPKKAAKARSRKPKAEE